MQRLRFGQIELSATRPTNISDPARILSMLMCMVYQQIANVATTGQTMPLYRIYKLPIHGVPDNTNLNILTWNSSQGVYKPCVNLFSSHDDILYNELLQISL